MIEVSGLTKHYGTTIAVDNLSFTVGTGERLLLVGTSGCGKTTTLKMLNRLVTPTAGTVHLDGEDVSALPPEALRRRMGYVIQHTGLFPHYTVFENIAVVPRLLGWPTDRTRRRAHELLEKLRLPTAYLDLYPRALSGGQQQRVGLARALAADPPVVLMDEPFGALDPITRVRIREEFKNLEELRKKTVVMVTHDATEAFDLADQLCLMHRGQAQQIGPPRELLLRPANDFVAEFFADQRLTLQWQTFTLADVAPFLPPVAETAGPTVAADTTLLVAMQRFGDGAPALRFAVESKSYVATPETLTPALRRALEAARSPA